jgi:hypothetical protein
MDSSDTTEIDRTRRIRRIALLISVIPLVILVLIAVGICVIAFVILSAMIGCRAVLPPTKLIMVTSKYPFAATTKTLCEWMEGTVPNPSIKDEAPYRICASKATPEGRAHCQRCSGESGCYHDWAVPQLE